MKNEKHQGRLAQLGIYLGKYLRMFIYQSDWKFLPMAAIIAGVVTVVVGSNMFVTQEGTLTGCFALVCVCLWNGVFNSIQVVCRERAILKREHRAGLHISSYLGAHVIYQFLLCLAQTVITLVICHLVEVSFPSTGIITPWGIVDIGITIFLITYTADLMALMISCIVRDTTTAMTVMPFVLMFQLIFSGGFFGLTGFAEKICSLTVSKWGLDSMCAVGRYNELPMVTLWNTIFKFKDVEIGGEKPLLELIRYAQNNGYRDQFLQWSGSYNTSENYTATVEHVLHNWGMIALLGVVFLLLSWIFLHSVDRDKR
ncbi:MAG: ABC transporter permease [Oscillospiraceae bacterium]|nr:ABC transporter permease [Oscillospiraceae bacterium]